MQSIESLLQSVFRLQSFRPHQREIIETVLAGNDCLCIMPTGAGKSLCFQMPAVALNGLTIVVSPLISLMADQVRQLRTLKVPAHFLNSSQPWNEQRQVLDEVRGGFRGLLYVAPERLVSESFLRLVPSLKPKLLVIDEAHCVSHWGHDFRPEYKRISEFREQLGSPTTIALTATATPQVRQDIVAMLKLRSPQLFVTGFDRPNLTYSVQRLESDIEKDAALLRFLKSHPGSGIVYCSTRKAVEAVADTLREKLTNRPVAAYHAGLHQDLRTRAQKLFIADPNAVAVATNAFGMGINKPETRFVIHYNLPGSLEAYYQEAGRAGRDGEPADCVLFYNQRDVRTQEFFVRNIGDNNPQLKPEDVTRLQQQGQLKLDKMYAFASQWKCRRRQVLEYFGERAEPKDCRCDVCANNRQPVAVTPPRRVASLPKTPLLSSGAEERFARLKQVRLEIARELKIAPFIVAHDKWLREMAESEIQDLQDFEAISGFGDKRTERYGLRFLEVLRSPQAARPPNPMPHAPTQRLPQPKTVRKDCSVAPSPTLSKLLTLREDLAKQHRLPPYFVLRDATLAEIARVMPPHIRALSEIDGVGEKKADQFGPAILKLLHG